MIAQNMSTDRQNLRAIVGSMRLFAASLVIVFANSSVISQEVGSTSSATVVARIEMKLQIGMELVDVIKKGDLLTVVEERDDAYIVLTFNGKRGLVPKKNVASLGESIEIYNQLIEENPRQGRLFTLRASSWWSRGESEKALADYNRAIELGYREARAYSSRGLFHAAVGNYDKAIADFTKAIERGAKDETPYINRAAVYLSQERFDLAIKDYDEAIRVAPENPTGFQLRAILHKNQGKLDLAIRDFGKAIEVDPNYTPAFMGRGFVWFQKEYWRKAVDDFTAVIKIDPNSARAFNNRGYNRLLLGQYKEALVDYEHAIRVAPNFALAHQNKAWLLASADEPEIRNGAKAIESANKACELNEFRNIGDVKALAAAYAESNDFEKAIQWQVKAIDLSPDANKPLEEKILDRYRDKQPLRFADFPSKEP